jgi:Zn-dependent peptidase ImmA (M78 family)
MRRSSLSFAGSGGRLPGRLPPNWLVSQSVYPSEVEIIIRDTRMLGRPENAAEQMLRMAGVDEDGNISLPVEPQRIVKKLGIKYYVADLGTSFTGMLVGWAARDAEIHVNREDSDVRQRFTCAHELGHYVMRSDDEGAFGEDWGHVAFRDSRSQTGEEPHEVWANRFAAALLMPRDLVEEQYRELPEVAILAGRFAVSAEAMSYRLRFLGLR